MPQDRLLKARKKTIGTKQTIKALERGQARVVYVALNAERHVVEPIVLLAQSRGIPVVKVDTMQELGRACGIEVGCASASVTEE